MKRVIIKKTWHRHHDLLSWSLFGVAAVSLAGYTTHVAGRAQAYQDSLYHQVQVIEITKPRHFALLPGVERPVLLTNDQSITAPGGDWTLVNKQNRIPLDFVPQNLQPTTVAHSDADAPSQVRDTIQEPLRTLFAAANAAGHNLMVGSAYRDAGMQQLYYDLYAARGGTELADRYSAHPGASEHQTGLAVDISSESLGCYAGACSLSPAAAAWLAEHCHEHGFVVRYEAGKETVTGYSHEPWHLRYFGVDLATALHESGLAYEEAVPYLLRETTE